jgi:hypothetical protein
MRQRPGYATNQLKIILLAVSLFFCWTATGNIVHAADSSRVELNIVPVVCAVDVVNDGNGQVLQTPSEDCDVIIPELLTPLLDQETQAAAPRLPFAGSNEAAVQLVAQPRLRDGVEPWSPIASLGQTDPVEPQNTRVAAVMVAGVSATAIATALGVDVALFEMRYSKTVMRLTRRLPISKLFR